jgi:CcdB protein
MADQYDVFQNPVGSLRKTYPVVVVLQSPFADLANSRIVAPATPALNSSRIAGVLTPVFEHDAQRYVLHVPALTTMRLESLRTKLGNIATSRDAITAALDHLFHDNS